jgi:hypothetical protein
MRLLPSTEYTEWQWPLSGVHSIMMEKLAQAYEAGGCTPSPCHYIYHQVQSCGVPYAPAEKAGTLLLFLLYPSIYLVSTLRPHLKNSLQVKELTENPVWISLSLTMRLY